MNIKSKLILASTMMLPAIAFAGLGVTANPAVSKAGSILQLHDAEVATYCNFQKDIVKLGFDSQGNTIFACVSIGKARTK